MTERAPLLDSRSELQIADQVRDLLRVYVPEWQPATPGVQNQLTSALIGVFARLAEIVINRLNQVPDKNFLAFVDLLGAAPLPPQPARVPLTFSLAAASALDGVVPAGTRVASPPAEGETKPVLFETERELVVTAAQLASVWTRDPSEDRYADYSTLVTAQAAAAVPAFRGTDAIEHILYLGNSSLFDSEFIAKLTVHVDIDSLPTPIDPREVTWETWNGTQWTPLTLAAVPGDTTAGLARTGVIGFDDVPRLVERPIGALSSRWLRCRLRTRITPGTTSITGRIRANQLPRVTQISLTAIIHRNNVPVERAFGNATAIDLTKAFFPFGEKPKFGDSLYIAAGEAFAESRASVALGIVLTNPADSTSPLPPTRTDGNPQLALEWWNGREWKQEGIAVSGQDTMNLPTFSDTTRAFTKSGTVTVTFSGTPAATTVNGVRGFWIRIRLVAGNYGVEAKYTTDGFVDATFAPPSIASIIVTSYLATKTAPPAAVVTANDFVYTAHNPSAALVPFVPTVDRGASLYFGFTLPPNRAQFPNRPITLYSRVADPRYGDQPDNSSPAGPPRLRWEYWNGSEWTGLTIRDTTAALARPGVVELLAPSDFAQRSEFALLRYWIRVRWDGGDYAFIPRLERVLPNTTMAAQVATVENEALGSSDGRGNQVFRAAQTPVLLGQRLEVREPDLPSVEEQTRLGAIEAGDGVRRGSDGQRSSADVWVRWDEVADFHASTPQDRHYTLDHLSGEIRFGNGVAGRIPPAGMRNIRLARYQTGGGVVGNRPAGSIVQLKTTVPYVDKVTNWEPSVGGAAAETAQSLLERAPRTVRHRNRAVTIQDYEDIAMLATPEVARTRCVPLYDLAVDADGKRQRAGKVSVIVVPRSTDAMPVPTLELLDRVRDHVVSHAIPTAEIVIVGPDYVRVDVSAEVVLTSLERATEVEAALRATLARFLHPLTGGLDGEGWDFGRRPHESDLYALIEAVPGVDHVRALRVDETDERIGAGQAGRFLVYSGNHHVGLTFDTD